jgi:hypothetical protein
MSSRDRLRFLLSTKLDINYTESNSVTVHCHFQIPANQSHHKLSSAESLPKPRSQDGAKRLNCLGDVMASAFPSAPKKKKANCLRTGNSIKLQGRSTCNNDNDFDFRSERFKPNSASRTHSGIYVITK